MPKDPTMTATSATCQTCGLPKELCVCETLEAEGTALRVRVDTRRYGKAVTVIDGFEDEETAQRLAKELKRGLATGGTSKDRRVELQGDHTDRAKKHLEQQGFSVDL